MESSPPPAEIGKLRTVEPNPILLQSVKENL